LFIDNTGTDSSISDVIATNRKRVSAKNNFVKLEFQYNIFNRSGYNEFNSRSSIQFQLKGLNYSVHTSGGTLVIEKLYGEQLSDKEINQLIANEIRKHKDKIESKIEQAKNK